MECSDVGLFRLSASRGRPVVTGGGGEGESQLWSVVATEGKSQLSQGGGIVVDTGGGGGG